tara:strand:+ start:57 stop:254 length:198 start_codon:yes stop_codon:yes gene_type:complete
MPKGSKKEALEKRLRAQGRKKGLSGDRLSAYIYGTLTKVMGPGGAKKASRTGKVRTKNKTARKRK